MPTKTKPNDEILPDDTTWEPTTLNSIKALCDRYYSTAFVLLTFITILVLLWQGWVTRGVGINTTHIQSQLLKQQSQLLAQESQIIAREAYMRFKTQYAEIKKGLPNKYQHFLVDVDKTTNRATSTADIGAMKVYMFEYMKEVYKNEVDMKYDVKVNPEVHQAWESSIEDYWNHVFDKWYFLKQLSKHNHTEADKPTDNKDADKPAANDHQLWEDVFGYEIATLLDYYKADINYGYYYVFCNLLQNEKWPQGSPQLKEAFFTDVRTYLNSLHQGDKDDMLVTLKSHCIVFWHEKEGPKQLDEKIKDSLKNYYNQGIREAIKKYRETSQKEYPTLPVPSAAPPPTEVTII